MSVVGPTCNTCSSELVTAANFQAVVAANCASTEPSVASRILVGNTLMWSSLLTRSRCATRYKHDATAPNQVPASEHPLKPKFAELHYGEVRRGAGPGRVRGKRHRVQRTASG